MNKRIELLAPVGSLANLKAAVSRKADAVYLGMTRFSARDYATNFNESYLKKAVQICRSNNVKLYLTMNTLVKNTELKAFFSQLSQAYSDGIDAVIIQEISFLEHIKKQFPDLRVHISTQAGVMNSSHAGLLSKSDRITLARELAHDEIKDIRKNFEKQLEIFCHGALCVSFSGSCLFSSLLGGRSGNRGKCAQPCRSKYNSSYYISTKELCLLESLPEIIKLGIDSVKIEGRMRTPYYVATATEIYRKAIDSYYSGSFSITPEMKKRLESAFSRDFTSGWFSSADNIRPSEDIFNRANTNGYKSFNPQQKKEEYFVSAKPVNTLNISRKKIEFRLPEIKSAAAKKPGNPLLLVRVYSKEDCIKAACAGADIVYLDLFSPDFSAAKQSMLSTESGKKSRCKLFAVTPRLMLDRDILKIKQAIHEKNPDGLLAGNAGILGLGTGLPLHLDYSLNYFNDIDVDYAAAASAAGAMPIISPELCFRDLKSFRNRDFAVLVHGRIRLMTLRHNLPPGIIKDETGAEFSINSIFNGSEILNCKELGLLGKSQQLVKAGITNFFIDTDQKVSEIVSYYRNVLDNRKPIASDSTLKKDYVLGWFYRGVE